MYLFSMVDSNTFPSQGTKLNPEAPEFTPRSVLTQGPRMSAPAIPGRHCVSEDYEEGSNTPPPCVHFAPVPIMFIPGVCPVYSQLPGDDSGQGTTTHKEGLNPLSTSTNEHTTMASSDHPNIERRAIAPRHPCYSRRVQSKSEPSGGGTTSEDC